MVVKYKGEDLELRYTLRIYLIYENIMGKAVETTDYSTMVTLLYATLVATLQYQRKQIDLPYQDFLDWIDENGGLVLISKFGKWFAEQVNIQAELIGEPEKLKGMDEEKGKKKTH